MVFGQRKWSVALYLRLSQDDDNFGPSESIQTQEAITRKYCKENGFPIYDTYIDDGWSGTNFDRPSFKRMIKDIETGKVNLVVVKDLARFGRDYIEVGYYTEKYFPELNVRFVAIDDAADTFTGANEEMMCFKNVYNSYYPKQCSKATKNALRSRAEDGLFCASKAPYGYIKSSEDRHKLIVDFEAAEVVKRIFVLVSEGNGYGKICKELRNSGILTPNNYFIKKNPDYYTKSHWLRETDWNNATLKSILFNEVYLGKIVHGRTKAKRISCKTKVRQPRELWSVVENVHEAIVSQILWDEAHKSLASRKKANNTGETHIFAGLLCCPDCGSTIAFKRRDFGKGRLNGEFVCGKYKSHGKQYCTTHYIRYEELYNIVLKDIQRIANEVQIDKNIFVENFKRENTKRCITKAAMLEREVKEGESRKKQLDNIIKKLYENYALGQITDERFNILITEYENEHSELRQKLEQMQSELSQKAQAESNIIEFTNIINEVSQITELDAPILNKLIDKIVIGQANEISGKKVQDITINYKISA